MHAWCGNSQGAELCGQAGGIGLAGQHFYTLCFSCYIFYSVVIGKTLHVFID